VVSAFDYHLVEKNTAFEVALEGVNLQEVLALEGDDVQGSGTIGGTLPVAIRAGAPSVSGGKVSAVPPRGRIQVSPALAAVTGQPGLDFALRALTDFYFSALDASVDYASDGELALGLSLRGGNPQVENGRPIHYNLNVTENVPVLLQSLRAQRAVIEGVERRVLR
jgi:hypothetical protein